MERQKQREREGERERATEMERVSEEEANINISKRGGSRERQGKSEYAYLGRWEKEKRQGILPQIIKWVFFELLLYLWMYAFCHPLSHLSVNDLVINFTPLLGANITSDSVQDPPSSVH